MQSARIEAKLLANAEAMQRWLRRLKLAHTKIFSLVSQRGRLQKALAANGKPKQQHKPKVTRAFNLK